MLIIKFWIYLLKVLSQTILESLQRKNQIILRVNDPLEKSLNLIVNKKYILSAGRLYGLLKSIKEDEPLYDFWRCFKDYLDKYSDLKNILLWDDF